MTARTAIIDIGSNSIRLVVYDGPRRIPFILFNEKVMAGLGAALSKTGQIEEPAMERGLVALARFNAGLAGTLQQAMVHEYERSGAAWTLEWLTLPQIFATTGASLRHAATLLDQISLN